MLSWNDGGTMGPGFAALREALLTPDGRSEVSGAMAGPQGQLLGWTVSPLTGGRRMLRFRVGSGQPLNLGQGDPELQDAVAAR